MMKTNPTESKAQPEALQTTPIESPRATQQSHSIQELAAALSKAQDEMQNPEKNKTVQIITKTGAKFSFDYADLGALRVASKEALKKNGLAIVHLIEGCGASNHLTTRLIHCSGQWVESKFPLTLADDIKVFAGEITYAKRYNKSALLDMFADDDNDAGEVRATPKATVQPAKTYQPKPLPPGPKYHKDLDQQPPPFEPDLRWTKSTKY